MPNKQANELSALTTLASNDLFIVYDSSEPGSEKIKKMDVTTLQGQLDAYTLQGNAPSAFSSSSHNHTGVYATTGDLATTSGTLQNQINNLSTDKISEGNSFVEVIDTGTGKVSFTIDGSEEFYMQPNYFICNPGSSIVIDHSSPNSGAGIGYSADTFLIHAARQGDFELRLGGSTFMYSSYNSYTNFYQPGYGKCFSTRPNGIQWYYGANTDKFVSQIADDSSFVYIHYGQGNPVWFQARNASGSDRNLWSGDPDGGTSLYYAGTEKLLTSNAGVEVTGTLNATTNITINGNNVATQAYVTSVSGALDNKKFDSAGGNISGNVTIAGDLAVNGTTFTVNTETVTAEDNLIIINSAEVGAGVTSGFAGIEVERGTLTNYQFYFDESQDNFRVGVSGSLQAVATREDSPTSSGLAFWNGTSYRMDTNANLTFSASVLSSPYLKATGTTKTTAAFYAGSTDPDGTTRLNYDGYFYATRVYNAYLNDIADFQEVVDEKVPGKCYYDTLEGAKICTERCQKSTIGILSDTYGLAAGYRENLNYAPFAVAGWVLAYVDIPEGDGIEPGDALSSNSTGNLIRMTDAEKREFPERIIAIYKKSEASEFWGPNNEIQVNGRHWVKVK